jgi:lipoate-protein ligase B
MTDLSWSWLGRQPYGEMLERQRSHRRSVIDGSESETLWLLEHDPTITTGRRAVPDLPAAEDLNNRGIALHRTERGGLATYHGPGQLIAYAIVDCWERAPGVWVGLEKVAAVGMHFKQGVSIHGVAINLTNSLDPFKMITPCGITDATVTSVQRLRGSAPTPEEAAPLLAPHLIRNLLSPICASTTPFRPGGLTQSEGLIKSAAPKGT